MPNSSFLAATTQAEYIAAVSQQMAARGFLAIGICSHWQVGGYWCTPGTVENLSSSQELHTRTDDCSGNRSCFVEYRPLKLQRDQLVEVVAVAASAITAEQWQALESWTHTYGMFAELESLRLQQSISRKQLHVYGNIFDNLEQGLLITDRNACITYYNQAFARLSGYNSSELYGRVSIETFLPPQLRAEAYNRLRNRLEGKIETFETPLVTKDQNLWYARVKAIPQFGNNGEVTGTLGIFTPLPLPGSVDLSMSGPQQVANVKPQRYLLHEIMDGLTMSVYLKDAEGRFQYANNSMLTELGLSYNQVLGRRDRDVLGPEWLAILSDTDAEVRAVGHTRREIVLPDNSAHRRYCLVEKRLLHLNGFEEPLILGTFTDISDRKTIERELDNQKSFAQQILDASPNFIFVKDWDGHFQLVNQAISSFYNKSKEELLAFNREEDHAHDPVLSKYLEQDRHVITTMQAVQSEDTLINYKGQPQTFYTSKVPLVRGDGAVNVLAIATNVTEQVNARRELELAREAAERATRAKDQFLSNMSHEIRTPVNGIIGFVQLLQETDVSPEQRDFVTAIRTSAENLRVIIDDILDFSKIQAGRLSLETIGFYLEEETRTLVSTFLPRAVAKNLRLELRIDRRLNNVVVLGDPVRYAQVLSNLLSNAIKFTSEGRIVIDIRTQHVDANMVEFTLRVTDTGAGIPADKLDLIFERFSQADESITRKYGGTGLGLSIVKQLVSMMHGSLTVESSVGKGTTFTIDLRLPVGSEKDLRAKKGGLADTASIETILDQKRVLLVEDNPVNQTLALSLLKKWNMRALVANNGREALDLLQDNPIDLVLLDIQMPVMDGFETAQYIRRQLPVPVNQVPIIALTANAFTGDMEACLQAGMNDYISKPFNKHVLMQKLARLLASQPTAALLQQVTSASGGLSSLIETQNMTDLTYLREFSGNDEEFIREMVEIFISRCDEDLPRIEEAARDGNWEELKGLIHKMKPSVTFMGLHSLTDVVPRCETLSGDAANADEVRMLVAQIVSTCRVATQELAQRLQSESLGS